MTPPLGLYLHIPFCVQRCAYCDFNTFAGLTRLFEPFTTALAAEIGAAGAAYNRPAVSTIFIGGGTPTALPPHQLAEVLAACRQAFTILPQAEITCEANPGTVDQAHFSALRALGVNRLSLGVQSFDDTELRWLGRIHSGEEAATAFAAARRAGFTNINLDFIFGLPGQAASTWAATLAQAVRLAPEHLSLYSLTVEPGTPLHDQVRRGQAQAPDDDLAAALYEQAGAALAAGGYTQYEISNWARAQAGDRDARCRHNLIYWRRGAYLGCGPGAHSFVGDRRWWNVKPVPQYIQRLSAGGSPERAGEIISPRLAMGETMMLGLRLTQEGVTESRFQARWGQPMAAAFGVEIADLAARGLLERLPDRVRLTPAGRLLGNQVFAAFL